jgi:hypothetical protein
MATEKPPLDAETWEQIEGSKYWVKKTYAEKLSPYLQDLPPIFEAMQKMPDGLPSPPKQPIKLCKVLAEYATALFDIEWTFYPKTDELPTWSRNLAQRVERDIIAHALNLGRRPVGLMSRFTIGLTYHASADQMREAVRGALKSRVGDLKPDAPRALPGTIPRSHEPKATTPRIEDPKADRKTVRKRFVEPILTAKGWSTLDWANESKVAYNTASDYLEGTTTPYRSTRLKLADGLSIDVDNLPE